MERSSSTLVATVWWFDGGARCVVTAAGRPSSNPQAHASAISSVCAVGLGSELRRMRDSQSRNACRNPSTDGAVILIHVVQLGSEKGIRVAHIVSIDDRNRPRALVVRVLVVDYLLVVRWRATSSTGQRAREQIRRGPRPRAGLAAQRGQKPAACAYVRRDRDAAERRNGSQQLLASLVGLRGLGLIISHAARADLALQIVRGGIARKEAQHMHALAGGPSRSR